MQLPSRERRHQCRGRADRDVGRLVDHTCALRARPTAVNVSTIIRHGVRSPLWALGWTESLKIEETPRKAGRFTGLRRSEGAQPCHFRIPGFGGNGSVARLDSRRASEALQPPQPRSDLVPIREGWLRPREENRDGGKGGSVSEKPAFCRVAVALMQSVFQSAAAARFDGHDERFCSATNR